MGLWLSNRKCLRSKPHNVASFNRQTSDFHAVKYVFRAVAPGNVCGLCWCQAVDMRLSRWMSTSSTDRPGSTTETADLMTYISLWKCAGLIWAAHITACLWFHSPEGLLPGPAALSVRPLILRCEMSVISNVERTITNSSCHNKPSWDDCVCTCTQTDRVATILKWAKREMKATHNSLGAKSSAAR